MNDSKTNNNASLMDSLPFVYLDNEDLQYFVFKEKHNLAHDPEYISGNPFRRVAYFSCNKLDNVFRVYLTMLGKFVCSADGNIVEEK